MQPSSYTPLEQLVHNVAFSTQNFQISLAEFEDLIIRKQLRTIPIRNPVFITSIPRSGTTILLKILSSTNAFASHSYRNMPFLLIPILWNKFSKPYWKKGQLKERAHKDGVFIDYDSPEAFEEVIWKSFWEEKYDSTKINLWSDNDNNEEFEHFFSNHVRKIIYLSGEDSLTNVRYLSKNNANIARIAYIKNIFSDKTILVPYRKPLQQAISLKIQHDHFLDIHRTDSFSKAYMSNIGHFEFGDNLRPFNFNDWLKNYKKSNIGSLDFFLEYWCEAFEHIYMENRSDILLFNYSKLCDHPLESLEVLARKLALTPSRKLTNQHRFLVPETIRDIEVNSFRNELIRRANDIYDRLVDISIN